MIYFNKFGIILCAAFMSQSTFANGNRVGNGGNVVSCDKRGDLELKVLDLYESDLAMKDVVEKNEFDLAKTAFKSLNKFDRKISEQYLKAVDQIKNDIDFKDKIEIQSSNDSKYLELPKGCKLFQIAVRKNQKSSIEKKFIFSRFEWEKLNTLHKAGLLIHEIIYDHFFKLGEDDSVKARKMTAYVLSKKIDQDSAAEIQKFISSLKVPLYRSP